MTKHQTYPIGLPAMRLALGAALVIAGSTPVASASLIAGDPFLTGSPADPANGEYAVTHIRRSNTSGAGQNPTIAGFTEAWTGNVTTGTSQAVAQWTAETAPITPPVGATTYHYPTGGRTRFAGVDNFHRRVTRSLDTYTPTDTYYFSLITQIVTGDTNGDGFVGVGFTNAPTDARLDGTADGLRGLLIGAQANSNGTTDLVIRHRDAIGGGEFGTVSTALASTVSTAELVPVNQVIVKLEVNAVDGQERVTVWLNPTNTSSEEAASLSVTPITFLDYSMTLNDEITNLTMTGIDYSKAASFDEPRFGTTFASVVPEPATAALFALAGLVLGRRRRA